jgi:hypothetical protein
VVPLGILLAATVLAVAPSGTASALPANEVFVGDATVVEGDGVQDGAAHFAVRLSAPAPSDVYVWFHTEEGSATHRTATSPDGDFARRVEGKAKVKIAAGKVEGNIAVPVYGDLSEEGDEAFTVHIDHLTTSVTGPPDTSIGLGRTPGTGTIRDDDPTSATATISIGDVAVPEGNPSLKGRAKLGVRLSEPLATDRYVYFHTVSESALGGTDFLTKISTSKVRVPAGKLRATITTAVLPDVDEEGDETYSVMIDKVATTVGGAHDPSVTILDGTGEVTILDDDVPPALPAAPTVTAADFNPDTWFSGDVDLTWDAPSDDGGRPITHYVIERTNDFGGSWAEITTITTTGTTVNCGPYGSSCRFRVTAYNSVGASEPSTPSNPLFYCFDGSCLL